MEAPKFAPIVIFCYNRPFHLKRLIESLKVNSYSTQSKLYIFSDGSKDETDKENVLRVREYIDQIDGFASVYVKKQPKNVGLAENVIEGVSYVLDLYDTIIVLEDDLVVSEDYLVFVNEALDFYKRDKRVHSVSGFKFPFEMPASYPIDVYLLPRSCSLGWATWKNRWDLVDWSMDYFPKFIRDQGERKKFELGGENLTLILLKQFLGYYRSWAIRWDYNRFLNNGYGLYPVYPKVINKGNDGSGTNDSIFIRQNEILSTAKVELKADLEVDEEVVRRAQEAFRLSLIKKIYFKYLLLKYYFKNI